ncbi:MAG: serine/threonine-protein phosphatase, partial [Balneolales bacterium]|nr:serine/threonine-protein phosphatase [Balneolales bacterium]
STIDLLKLMSKGIRNMDLHMLYMTATIIKITDNQIRLVGAGMPPALLYKAKSGTVKQLISRGMPLGSKPDFPYKEISENVESGDVLLLSSDGLIEAMDSNRTMFGIEKLTEQLLSNGTKSPEIVIESVYQSMCRWTGTSEIQDDVTMVALKVK